MQQPKNKKVMPTPRVTILFDERELTDDAKRALQTFSEQLEIDGVIMEIGQDPKEHRYP